MECSRVLDKSSTTNQYISVLYDIFTLGCSTFDLNENGTSSKYKNKKKIIGEGDTRTVDSTCYGCIKYEASSRAHIIY